MKAQIIALLVIFSLTYPAIAADIKKSPSGGKPDRREGSERITKPTFNPPGAPAPKKGTVGAPKG